MPEKNPYETQNTVEIPSFIGQTPKSAPVTEERAFVREMVQDIQKEAEMEAPVYEEVEVEEEVVERKPRKRRKINLGGVMSIVSIVLGILCIVLLLSLVSKNNALKLKTSEYETLVKTTETKNAAYEAEIAKLNNEINELKNPVVKPETSGTGTRYYVEADGGIRLRKGPGANYDLYTDFAKLPSAIQSVCNEEKDVVYLNGGATITVYETSGSGDEIWGRIGDGAWVAIRHNGDDWCVAVK